MNGLLYLEDGSIYKGKSFGKSGTAVGELVFNTSMVGYEEILTDPSYAGQIVTMTYPLIGNYGINREDMESTKVYSKGLIVKKLCNVPSHYMSNESLDSMLNKMNIVGIQNIDTRSIVRKIRSNGSMKCVISNENISLNEMKNILNNYNFNENLVEMVSRKSIAHIKGSGYKVAVMDFGIKKNIIENLKNKNCDLKVIPYNTPYEEIVKLNIDGIFLSNGPGDPKDLPKTIETIKKLIGKLPIFGICLGHQLLTLALGGDTYKMKFGHRGGNHGVYDIEKDKVYITSQNHGYAVDRESIKNKDIVITHVNLNDNTVEGIRHKYLPIFSVQFHPEGAPGPNDSIYLFDRFIELLSKDNNIKSA
ncbi:glutamine-hydrolyzing carbamoyl-phosphate synthase small subunit [Clostridium rectalis]|uniref:glutamine-hydrolyzing carbamoyl-phosphate synthase small subunit n=1 Tax=Clostridium rectalis TaxID=2040295 RepID=UPI000F62E8DE|nr:glutamine-hydrolyzing carbamoyl-phosphate synthase small subunit [Clostridium rectalis]